MKKVLRARPFLVLAAVILVLFIIGQFWQAPFHDDEVGFTRFFGHAWEAVFLPVRFALGLLWAAGLGPSRFLALLVFAAYVGIFVGLDQVATKLTRRVPVDAA
jgi:hypothetical protein